MSDLTANNTESKIPTPEAGAPDPGAGADVTANEAAQFEQEERAEPLLDETTRETEEVVDDTIANLIAELTEARKEADAAKDQALRAQAELQNFRRRKERETSERITHANAGLLIELLPVLDDFERAFDNVPDDISTEDTAWVDGFRLILRKLHTVLEREHVTAIDTSGAFDPNLHEAISVEPREDITSGDIIAEVRRGYKIHDRVLRPSVVRVAQ